MSVIYYPSPFNYKIVMQQCYVEGEGWWMEAVESEQHDMKEEGKEWSIQYVGQNNVFIHGYLT